MILEFPYWTILYMYFLTHSKFTTRIRLMENSTRGKETLQGIAYMHVCKVPAKIRAQINDNNTSTPKWLWRYLCIWHKPVQVVVHISSLFYPPWKVLRNQPLTFCALWLAAPCRSGRFPIACTTGFPGGCGCGPEPFPRKNAHSTCIITCWQCVHVENSSLHQDFLIKIRLFLVCISTGHACVVLLLMLMWWLANYPKQCISASPGPIPNPRPCACFLSYSPICGTDGRTYSNSCELRCTRAKEACKGACPCPKPPPRPPGNSVHIKTIQCSSIAGNRNWL